MAKNLFIFNFKKLPKAATAAILFILLIEGGSWIALKMIVNISRGGDLIRMDSCFFNKNLRKYGTDTKRDKRYLRRTYDSWKECWTSGPYDVIVTGDSTGNTGFAEMLQEDYGRKTLNFAGTSVGIGSLLANYDNGNNTDTVLLWVTLRERIGQTAAFPGDIKEQIKSSKGCSIRPKGSFASKMLIEYISDKMKCLKDPRVELIDINGSTELFYDADMKALTGDMSYSSDEYLRLCEQHKYIKDIAAEKGCIYAIIAFPTKPQQYEWLLIREGRLNSFSKRKNLNMLKEACRKNDIPFLDIEEKLDPVARQVFQESGKLFWYRCDTHMNEMGAYYSAKLINDFLSQLQGHPAKEHVHDRIPRCRQAG